MKIKWMLTLFCATMLVSACGNNPCSQGILERFQRSDQAKFSEQPLVGPTGQLVENQGWYIKNQGGRCVVGFTAKVNGKKTEFARWYIDPKAEMIYADSEYANFLTQRLPLDKTLPK